MLRYQSSPIIDYRKQGAVRAQSLHMASSSQSLSSNAFFLRHGPWLGATLLLTAFVTAFFWKALLTDRVLAGYDLSTYFYPYRQYAALTLRQANLPLWNPYLFQGAPFLANQQTAVLYPPNLLYLLFSAETGLALSIAAAPNLGCPGSLRLYPNDNETRLACGHWGCHNIRP